MFAITNICLILCLALKINGLFVEVGDHGYLNEPECGLKRAGSFVPISFQRQCYSNQYSDKTVFIERLKKEITGRVLTEESEFGSGAPQSRLFVGHLVDIEEAPWTVRIILIFKYSTIHDITDELLVTEETCTGALISFEWVITAAKCIHDKTIDGRPLHSIFVYAGHQLITAHEIKDIRVSLSKVFKFGNTIALLKLDSKFERVERNGYYLINTICLPKIKKRGRPPKIDYGNKDYEVANFTGFGRHWLLPNTDKNFPLQLKDFKLSPYQDCTRLPPDFRYSQVYCSIDMFKTCAGDLGGPLFQFSNETPSRAILIAVLGSFETVCNVEKATQTWFPTMLYIDWITYIVRNEV